MSKVKDLTTILGLATMNYCAIVGIQYIGFSASLVAQEKFFQPESAIESAERVLDNVNCRPHHPGRVLFGGIEAAASNYLLD